MRLKYLLSGPLQVKCDNLCSTTSLVPVFQVGMTLFPVLGWSSNPDKVLALFPPCKSDWVMCLAHLYQARAVRAFPGVFAASKNETEKKLKNEADTRETERKQESRCMHTPHDFM